MSEILARICVRETAGIRRFLYPLIMTLELPNSVDIFALGLQTEDGHEIPLLVSLVSGRVDNPYRIDFAVSLAPLSTLNLLLRSVSIQTLVNDPLRFGVATDRNCLRSNQQHLTIEIGWHGCIEQVIYDTISHLRKSSFISRNKEIMRRDNFQDLNGEDLLTAWIQAEGIYSDGCQASIRVELTACKSWTTLTHRLEQPRPNDEIIFTLPLAITAPTLTCDFGVGGYVFGKIDEKAAEIVWRTEFGDAPYAKWTVASAGRTDYVGEVDTAEEFLPQRWFHLIDSDKALAVAITKLPADCQEMTITLNISGDVVIAFRLGETITNPAEFGVCYHFLNDVPAIAAATNPQSILLPPIVEVLPM